MSDLCGAGDEPRTLCALGILFQKLSHISCSLTKTGSNKLISFAMIVWGRGWHYYFSFFFPSFSRGPCFACACRSHCHSQTISKGRGLLQRNPPHWGGKATYIKSVQILCFVCFFFLFYRQALPRGSPVTLGPPASTLCLCQPCAS